MKDDDYVYPASHPGTSPSPSSWRYDIHMGKSDIIVCHRLGSRPGDIRKACIELQLALAKTRQTRQTRQTIPQWRKSPGPRQPQMSKAVDHDAIWGDAILAGTLRMRHLASVQENRIFLIPVEWVLHDTLHSTMFDRDCIIQTFPVFPCIHRPCTLVRHLR